MSGGDPFDGRVYDPDVDDDEPKPLTAEQQAEFEREMRAIEEAFPDVDAEPPQAGELDAEGNVVETKGEQAARGAVVAEVPKRLQPNTQVMKKVVERSRVLETQPAIRFPKQSPTIDGDSDQQDVPQRRVGLWALTALALGAIIAIVVWVTNGDTRAATDEPTTTATGDATGTAAPTVRAPSAATTATSAVSYPAPSGTTSSPAPSSPAPSATRTVRPPGPGSSKVASPPPSSKPANSSIFIHD